MITDLSRSSAGLISSTFCTPEVSMSLHADRRSSQRLVDVE
jgi:hypothetical protein